MGKKISCFLCELRQPGTWSATVIIVTFDVCCLTAVDTREDSQQTVGFSRGVSKHLRVKSRVTFTMFDPLWFVITSPSGSSPGSPRDSPGNKVAITMQRVVHLADLTIESCNSCHELAPFSELSVEKTDIEHCCRCFVGR